MRGAQTVAMAGATAVLLAVAILASADEPVINELTSARQRELRQLLFQDCGSCHGLTLQGGLGPALTAAALDGKSPAMLREVIVNGRPGTPMPPWRPFLSDADTAWLVEQMQRGIGDAR